MAFPLAEASGSDMHRFLAFLQETQCVILQLDPVFVHCRQGSVVGGEDYALS